MNHFTLDLQTFVAGKFRQMTCRNALSRAVYWRAAICLSGMRQPRRADIRPDFDWDKLVGLRYRLARSNSPSMVLQAVSASTKVLNGEPLTLTAPLPE
jgi:hypothetical protein